MSTGPSPEQEEGGYQDNGVVLGPGIDRSAPRPLLAILQAEPGRTDELREVIVDLTRHNRAEPGCIAFIPYESDRFPGRFYLYEIFADADAFETHLGYEHVKKFRATLPQLSTSGPADVVQLIETPVPNTEGEDTVWTTDYSTDTDLAPEAVWAALRDWSTGAAPQAGGDRYELHGAFAVGATITARPDGQDADLESTIVKLAENELFATETPFNGLTLLTHYSLRPLDGGGTHITRKLVIGGDNAAAMGPKIGPHIAADFPEAMDDLLTIARKAR